MSNSTQFKTAFYRTLVNLSVTASCGMTRKDFLSAHANITKIILTIPDKGCISGGTRHIVSEDTNGTAYEKTTISAFIRGVCDVGEKGETLLIPCVVADANSKIPGQIRASAYDANEAQEKDANGGPVAHMLDIPLDRGDYFVITVLPKRNYAEITDLTAADGRNVALTPNPIFAELLEDTDYCIPEEAVSISNEDTPIPTDA